MKVLISYTIRVDDTWRWAINRYYDRPGFATRQDVKTFYELHGYSLDDEISNLANRLAEKGQVNVRRIP